MQNNFQEDELDLSSILSTCKRRWSYLALGASFGLVGALLFNTISKPIWQGSFQIVIASSDSGGGLAAMLGSNPLAQLAGIGAGGMSSELDTQIKTLESPLVMKPIFEYVKTHKLAQDENVKRMKFQGWVKKNLEIKQAKNTSILTVTYSDNDYTLILPVLNRISEAYQDFSGRDRSDAINRGLRYLNTQVTKLRGEAEASNRALDAYSIRYGINNKGGSTTGSPVDIAGLLGSGGNNIGNASARQRQLSSAAFNSSSSATQSTNFTNQGEALSQLASINQELIRRQQLFTDRDPSIKALIRERNALRKYIETTAGGNVALPGNKPFTKEQAQEIMLNYQKLDRTAKRNNAILDSLERNLLSLQLEQARATKPWELISQPTVSEDQIFPKNDLNLALGMLGGLFIGVGGALFADRRSAVVFERQEISQYLPYPILANLHRMNDESWTENLALLAQGPLTGAVQVALIPVGKIEQSEAIANHLQTAIQMLDPAAQLLLSQDLTIARRCAVQVLIAAPGAATRNELQQLNQKLQLQGKPVLGLLWIDDAA